MSFVKSISHGLKLYFFMSISIGLWYFIDIQRNDLKGNLENSMLDITYSIEILTLVFPLFCFYVGSIQSNLIKRKTDTGFVASISAAIGFLMLTYMNWAIVLASLWVADANSILDNSEIVLGIEKINEELWRIIPAIFAGLFSAIINNTSNKNIENKKFKENEENENKSQKPWIYSVGVVDEHGFEWISHNDKKWYRAANSGDEWKEYSI